MKIRIKAVVFFPKKVTLIDFNGCVVSIYIQYIQTLMIDTRLALEIWGP